jgi:hypothetical protein
VVWASSPPFNLLHPIPNSFIIYPDIYPALIMIIMIIMIG